MRWRVLNRRPPYMRLSSALPVSQGLDAPAGGRHAADKAQDAGTVGPHRTGGTRKARDHGRNRRADLTSGLNRRGPRGPPGRRPPGPCAGQSWMTTLLPAPPSSTSTDGLVARAAPQRVGAGAADEHVVALQSTPDRCSGRGPSRGPKWATQSASRKPRSRAVFGEPATTRSLGPASRLDSVHRHRRRMTERRRLMRRARGEPASRHAGNFADAVDPRVELATQHRSRFRP